MPSRPYTEDDLRAEAARQLTTWASDLDHMEVLARMEDAPVVSTETADGTGARTWKELLVDGPQDDQDYSALSAAREKVHALIHGAADVYDWAISLGADGLQPEAHTVQLGARGTGEDDEEQPFVRVHFAFHPDATDEERARYVLHLSARLAGVPERPAPAADDIVAYRDPGRPSVLLCRTHGHGWYGLTPLTADDLPHGGICTYGRPNPDTAECGVDVLTATDR